MLAMNIAPHLIPKVQYPLYERGYNIFDLPNQSGKRRLDRIQVRIAPDRFAIAVRHNVLGHWCGYVMIPEKKWNSLTHGQRSKVRAATDEQISFAGISNAYITWCIPTKRSAKLSIPVMIQADEIDHWLGFSTVSEPPIADESEVYSRLLIFEDQINKALGAVE